ncbi:LysR family transcriptional regulator [Rhizobium ruizarguesonis]|nr:LysR family transcriptional regulator [Rhizobium leguminosarum]NEH38216.1 LysR family transcriptional regulator [Rhizobium ruizarguesonis]NKL13336.1 LysR family transcriptional regulator [Rhizobium leguminosarum bv. viciae]MBY5873425.1 LysR family transcriptional regulator [Rhizobium leguminosarum]MBY5892443.1 LysR family transcriptional regulator [Rhizobium leguminosarum]
MDFRRLDMNLILVFGVLYAQRSVTVAARELGMSQPTISAALNKMRIFFKDELFVRRAGSMQPTPFADSIADPVSRILETIRNELLQEKSFDPATTDRVFSVSMSDIGELVWLPTLLRVLRDEAPNASIRCVSLRPTELKDAMANGSLDLAVGYFPDLSEASFFQQKLFDHPFACIVRRDHPRIGDAISAEQFLEAEHAIVAAEGRSQEIFEKRMLDLGLKRRVLLRSPHYMSLPVQIAHSDMVSVVPRAVAQLAVQTANVKALEPPFEIPAIELKQFWHRRVNSDLAIIWFRGQVARHFLNRDPTSDPLSPLFGQV